MLLIKHILRKYFGYILVGIILSLYFDNMVECAKGEKNNAIENLQELIRDMSREMQQGEIMYLDER